MNTGFNHRAALDAGGAFCVYFERQLPGANKRGRQSAHAARTGDNYL